jgi:hypothetical protein
VTGKSRRHGAGPFLSCRLRTWQASRQQRACFVQMKVSLSVLACASLSGATTKPNQSECRRPRTLADLAPTESLWTPSGAQRAAFADGWECSSSASVVGSIVSCDARYQGSMPLAPSAPPASVISTLTTALLGWSPDQKGSV